MEFVEGVGTMRLKEFDVALSFAGEDRPYAEELAKLLEAEGYSVFYDEFQQDKLWGKDLYQYLSKVYRDKARYCVMFLSEHYARKMWTKHELQSAQARAFEESQEYILPIRLDNTEISGILSTVGYLDLREMEIEQVYEVLSKKLSDTEPQRAITDIRTLPEGYFQSLDSFESAHIKRSRHRHIYLDKFVEAPSRQKNISTLVEFVENADATLLLIYSHGGIGKTRFVLETLKRLNERTKNVDILLNQGKQRVDVDEVIPEISEDKKSLVVLDDAHLIDNLRNFEKILIKRDCAKLILITRSTAQESVKRQIDFPMEELELTPLDRESSIELLKSNLEYPLLDLHLRHLAHICEGNPLLVGITTHLINSGAVKSFGALKTDKLIKNYLKTILAELKQSNCVDRHLYEAYLALLFLLRPFAVNDAETRSLIRKLVDINEWQEGSLLKDLEDCAVLERHGDTLWLYPDLLGEYLVETTFFSDTPILNFDCIFPHIPASNMKSVFKTLRDLDNSKVGLFLKKWANNLANEVESQDNYVLFYNLELLEIIVSEVTDGALQVIDILLNPENEKPPWTSENTTLPTTQEFLHVLWQCLRILEYQGLKYLNFDETIEQLLVMCFYKPEKQEYSALRERAFNAIVSTAGYDLDLWQQGWEYSIQTKMFEQLQKWKQEDVGKYLPLILGVCGKLLETEMSSEYWNSEGYGWSRCSVVITDDLVSLRESVISLLQLIFDGVQGVQQIDVIRVLNCATEFPDLGQYGEDMRTMIRDNAEALINFYLRLVTATKSLEDEIFQEIETQIYHLKTWHLNDIKNVNRLLSLLQSHESYQLYRTLVGDDSLFRGDDNKSYDEIQVETADKIKKIADAITDENLIEWSEKLNGIAEKVTDASGQDFFRFYELLFEIGKNKPHTAQILIDKSLTEGNALKRVAVEFIRGIRKSSHPDTAEDYLREWLSGEDLMLFLQIPNAYRQFDEKSLAAGDVEIFETLLNCKMEDEKQRQKLDRSIMSNIRWIYKKNPEKITEIICQLFKRGDEDSIIHHINELWWSREQIDLSKWDLKVFEEILQKFVDLLALDRCAAYVLAQYGQKAPLELVPFFEQRVEKKKQTRGSFSRYAPIPHFLKEVAEIYQDHPRYVDVLNQIFVWFRKRDVLYDTAAADLIARISPQLEGPLKQTLIERIESGDAQNILSVMKILERFPEDSVSDELCKEAVKHSEGRKELGDEIAGLILYRSRVYRGFDGAVTTFQSLKEQIVPWREDEDPHVRAFAQRIIPKIESRIEYERERAAEDEIKRKKGLM